MTFSSATWLANKREREEENIWKEGHITTSTFSNIIREMIDRDGKREEKG